MRDSCLDLSVNHLQPWLVFTVSDALVYLGVVFALVLYFELVFLLFNPVSFSFLIYIFRLVLYCVDVIIMIHIDLERGEKG